MERSTILDREYTARYSPWLSKLFSSCTMLMWSQCSVGVNLTVTWQPKPRVWIIGVDLAMPNATLEDKIHGPWMMWSKVGVTISSCLVTWLMSSVARQQFIRMSPQAFTNFAALFLGCFAIVASFPAIMLMYLLRR